MNTEHLSWTGEDGEYTIEVTLTGGSGRASVVSPAELTVENGQPYALIEWNSSNYDYMKVEGETYLPVNEEGNSAFEIPVTVFDEPMTVIGDTTAMSVPHEIEYTLVFDSSTISPAGTQDDIYSSPLFYVGALIVVFAAVRVLWGTYKRKGAAK